MQSDNISPTTEAPPYDPTAFRLMAMAAIAIFLGVLSKRMGEINDVLALEVLGALLFVGGWVAFYVYGSPRSLRLAGAVLVVTGAIITRLVFDGRLDESYSMVGSPLFLIGWILFASDFYMSHTLHSAVLGIGGIALLIAGAMTTRQSEILDFPRMLGGVPFLGGWMLIAYASSSI